MEKSTRKIIADNVFTLFNLYNLIIAIALVAVGAYTNTFFFAIVTLNVLIGIAQEIHGRNLVRKLSILNTAKITVLRDGREEQIDADGLAKGDILVLRQGDQIPADSVVTDGGAEVNEALLTGESDSVAKRAGDALLSGSFVVSGKCLARVEHVGAENFAEKVMRAAKKQKGNSSELIDSMKKVTQITSFIILPVGALLFVQAYFFREATVAQAVVCTAAALLGMLPKGLVLLITIALESGVIKLAKKNVLVQNMYSIETLAHVDTLCLDKTGTLTEGKMHVTRVWKYQDAPLPFAEMMASFVKETTDSNATFAALRENFAGNAVYRKSESVPFSSERKWSSVSFENAGTVIVGAPEIIFPEKLFEKSAQPLTAEIRQIQAQIRQVQAEGKRVLAIAYTKETISEPKLPEVDVIAAVVLEDALRKNAQSILGYFKEQGVDVKVISGDNALTVSAIAKRAGLPGAEACIDLSAVEENDFSEIVEKYNVFARVMPEQKSALVQALQKKGHTVAMTGDGVNDVIALREADCSITLSGAAECAKQVSQIVLLDSDFGVLKDVLMEGRRVVNNITNVARIFFIKTIYSVLLSLFCIIMNMQFPFQPIQITLVDLAIEGYTSFFLSFEENRKRIQGTFLRTALSSAFPFAVTIMINILILTFTGSAFGLSVEMTAVTEYLLIGFVSILAVQEACMPWNKVHMFLFGTTAVGFYAAVVLFHSLLKITLPPAGALAVFVAFAAADYALIWIKRRRTKERGILHSADCLS